MKTTWKWVPVARYHISGMEEYLSRMAADGLLFLGLVGPLAKFQVGEPKPRRRYRLAVDPDYFRLPPAQMAELYESAGWRFASPIWGRSFFVFWSDDPMADEPYTDDQSRAESLSQIVRICRGEAVFFTLYFLIYMAMLLAGLWLLVYMKEFSYGLIPSVLLGMIPYTLFCVSTLQNLLAIRRLRRWLEEGNALRDFTPPKFQLTLQSACWTLILTGCLSAILTIPPYLMLQNTPLWPLEEAPQKMELLLLSDMEDPGYQPDEFDAFHFPDWISYYRQAGWAYNNYYQQVWAPFYPKEYTIQQSGKTADGSPASMTILRYDMVFSKDVEPKLNEMMADDSYQELAMEGADRFLISEDGAQVLAALGRRVLQVNYSGGQELSDWYAAIVEMLHAEK